MLFTESHFCLLAVHFQRSVCAGECLVVGQSHFKTFDNKFFTFTGRCQYLLARDCIDSEFSVIIENVQVSPRGFQIFFFIVIFFCCSKQTEWKYFLATPLFQCADDQDAVCTRSVTLSLPSLEDMTVKLKHGGVVSVNGMDIQMPMHHGWLLWRTVVWDPTLNRLCDFF